YKRQHIFKELDPMKKIISLFLINLLICFSAFSFGFPHKLYPNKGLKKSTFKFTYMKFRFLSFIPLLFLTINLVGFQNPASKNFRVNNFHSLEIGNAFEIHIQKGNVYSLTALGRDEDLQEIELSQSGNNLHVYRDTKWSWGWNKDSKKVILKITMPKIMRGDFSGAAKVFINGFTDEEQVRLSFSGASKVDIAEINADKLILDFSGASKANLSGHVGKLEVETSGASHLILDNLYARDVDVNSSGASHIQVNAQKTLQVDASGASKITYKGRPNIIKDVSGASFVQRAD
ncbi:MAG: DUF2807 domain-containing protein, partial [Cytophagia bacterium]|nr:DUF2807 domain-containing protein [Cytophagia bacterium]